MKRDLLLLNDGVWDYLNIVWENLKKWPVFGVVGQVGGLKCRDLPYLARVVGQA
jgi:hypothetical protein